MKKPLLVRRIVGESMIPSFRQGRIILAWGFGRPKPGDVVIVVHEGLEKIKRVSRIDGDKLFLLGDNPASSTDSRHFGWIDCDAVRARVVWPFVHERSQA